MSRHTQKGRDGIFNLSLRHPDHFRRAGHVMTLTQAEKDFRIFLVGEKLPQLHVSSGGQPPDGL
jgi:hypothetical protein